MSRIVSFGASVVAGVGVTENYTDLLSAHLNCTAVNCGKPASSNLEILYDILNFKFEPDDIVTVLWTEHARDIIFHENVPMQLGAWLKNKVVKNWLALHTPYDLSIRTWISISHADIFFKEQNIKACHLFQTTIKRPSFVKLKNVEFNIEKELTQDVGSDKLHPGTKSHTAIYELLRDRLCK